MFHLRAFWLLTPPFHWNCSCSHGNFSGCMFKTFPLHLASLAYGTSVFVLLQSLRAPSLHLLALGCLAQALHVDVSKNLILGPLAFPSPPFSSLFFSPQLHPWLSSPTSSFVRNFSWISGPLGNRAIWGIPFVVH